MDLIFPNFSKQSDGMPKGMTALMTDTGINTTTGRKLRKRLEMKTTSCFEDRNTRRSCTGIKDPLAFIGIE